MTTPNALTSRIIPVNDASPRDRDEMWHLYRRFYAGTHRDLFESDLAQKDSLLLLRDAEQRIQGFSTLAVGITDHDGKPVRYVFSGDTIVDRAHWGSQALAFSWLRYVGELKRERPELPLYWFLIVKGHRTFRYLPAFAREFYPHWQHPTPPALASLMTALARARFGTAFDAASGVVRYPESHGHLAEPFAEANEREAEREDVSFFLRRNSGYRRGDELVCLCELSAENLRPLARRLFLNGADERPPPVRKARSPAGAWREIADAAARETEQLERALAAPARQQAEFLRGLLDANRDTRFGREHGFERIRDVADFRRAVPLRTDLEFAPWLAAAARGEPAVLTADAPVAFESTGGSAGAKHIPYTAAALDAFRAGVLPWLGYLLESQPRIAGGVAYVAASPLTRRARQLPCGLPLGLPSDAAYLGAALAPALARVITVPPASSDIASWAETTMAHLAQRRDLALISVWSPTFLLELLDAAPAPPQEMWPALQVVSMWMDGASAPYAERVAQRLPGVALDAKGVLATESVITVRTRAGCVPALTSAFLEFIDARGGGHLAHELQAGERYRVALTTPGGLYRYDIGDEFECARAAGVPTLRFIGRAGVVSDLVGEKLSDSFVARALAPLGAGASLVPRAVPHPHYELWLDSATSPEAGMLSHIEARLRENPQYDYARELGQLRALEIVHAPGFARDRAHALARGGGRLGDAKSRALILDPA